LIGARAPHVAVHIKLDRAALRRKRNSALEKSRRRRLGCIARRDRLATARDLAFQLADARRQFGRRHFRQVFAQDNRGPLLLGNQIVAVDRHFHLRSRRAPC